jgi:hypothetical protein
MATDFSRMKEIKVSLNPLGIREVYSLWDGNGNKIGSVKIKRPLWWHMLDFDILNIHGEVVTSVRTKIKYTDASFWLNTIRRIFRLKLKGGTAVITNAQNRTLAKVDVQWPLVVYGNRGKASFKINYNDYPWKLVFRPAVAKFTKNLGLINSSFKIELTKPIDMKIVSSAAILALLCRSMEVASWLF